MSPPELCYSPSLQEKGKNEADVDSLVAFLLFGVCPSFGVGNAIVGPIGRGLKWSTADNIMMCHHEELQDLVKGRKEELTE